MNDRNNSLYSYEHTPTDLVMESPEQYIIPECIDCCKNLWSKGIDTYQCGNYDDPIENGFWVEIDSQTLSEENWHILESLEQTNPRVSFFEGINGQHGYRISVPRKETEEASAELCEIAELLALQDTIQYVSEEEFLHNYKKVGGEPIILPMGYVDFDINPERKNATLVDALQELQDKSLYVREEGRIYNSRHALNVHMNYLNKLENTDAKKR